MRLYSNGNLRSASRDLVGDFNNQRQWAATGDTDVSGARLHRISLNLGANTYTLQRCTTADSPGSPCNGWEDLEAKNLSAFGNDIVFDPGNTTTTVFDFQTRGTVMFSDEGEIQLRNNRGSTAKITANISGRTFVEFNMQ
jgi:hypothetical protein